VGLALPAAGDGGDNAAVELLIEREREAEELGGVIEAAVTGNGGALLVEGEAGIGKTRLLATARGGAAGAGARVLHASSDETEAGVPLAAARALFARASRGVEMEGPARLGALALRGALADPAGPGSRADEVVHALWWLIVELADEQPLAVFLDDAHWADELSLRLLRLMARRAPDLPLALIVAARPAAGQPHAMLAAERAFTRLEPAPLSSAGTARLIEGLVGRPGSVAVVGRARALTRGNPLYLSELVLRARERGADPASDAFFDGRAPPQLVRLVADRLERLSPAAAALARAVAVLGSDADPARARTLAGLTADDAILAEEILRRERVLDPEEFAFAHPLVAVAARDSIGAREAAALHSRAAELLSGAGADGQRIAEHLARSVPCGDARVVATLREAAEASRRVGAPVNAARLLARALAEPPSPAIVDAVELEHGRAMLDAGAPEAERLLGRLLDRTPAVGIRVEAARRLARHLGLGQRSADAVSVLRDVLATLGEADREQRLELLVELGFTGGADLATREDAIRTIAAEAAQSAGRTPAEQLLSATARIIGGEWPLDAAAATAVARDLLGQRLHRDHWGGYAVGSLIFSATATLMNGDALDEAERAIEGLRRDAEAMGLPELIAASFWQQAQIAYQRGDLARCELEAQRANETGGVHPRRLATPWLVMALVEQARRDEAEQLLDSAGMLGPIPPNIMLTAILGSRGRLRLAQGDAARAVEDLAGACERNKAWARAPLEPPWRPLLAEALVLADRGREANEEATSYTARATEWGTRRGLGHAARMRALVAPRAASITLLEEARAHLTASNARLELARCLVELGARNRAAGERRAARAILRDAHDAAHACQATALCQQARAELLLAGGRPRPPTGAGAASLTPAERRVAELAAEGATNRDIGRRLYLSPKTIEMHLRSVYRKLDIPGRGHLAAALR
jgi:DNA-binding CsgD family transcriptional regulator